MIATVPELTVRGSSHNMRLRWDSCTDEATLVAVRAAVFGILVQLAAPTVRHYHSDLFHDANWLTKHVVLPDSPAWMEGHFLTTFAYGVRDTGTDIGTDIELIKRHNERVFQVIVSRDEGGLWTANVWRAQ